MVRIRLPPAASQRRTRPESTRQTEAALAGYAVAWREKQRDGRIRSVEGNGGTLLAVGLRPRRSDGIDHSSFLSKGRIAAAVLIPLRQERHHPMVLVPQS